MATSKRRETSPDERIQSEPSVTLYTAASPDAQQAAQALRDADISFRIQPPKRGHEIVADFGGLRFDGLEGVIELISILQKMEEAFIHKLKETMPDLFVDATSSAPAGRANGRQRTRQR